MKTLLITLALTFILGPAVHAAPTKQSFEELMKLTDTQSVIDDLGAKLDELLEDAFYQVIAHDRATTEGLAYRDAFRKKVLADFHRENALGDVTDAYLKRSEVEWTQEEVDALLAFGRTPAGRSALVKLASTSREFAKYAQRRQAQFRDKTRESLKTSIQEMKVITTKALGTRSPAPEAAKPANEPAPALPPPAPSTP